MNLSKKTKYEKVEMTARDVHRLLKALWQKAGDVLVPKPVDRNIFHALLLLLSYDGFWSGMMISRLNFRDVVMAVIRDPIDRERRRLVVILIVPRNKLKADALEQSKISAPELPNCPVLSPVLRGSLPRLV